MSLIDCFLDDYGGGLPVYDTDKTCRTYFATPEGISSQTGKGSMLVPCFQMTDQQVEDRIVQLLIAAVRDSGWKYKNPFEHAETDFRKRELHLKAILTSADHPLIPVGWRIATAEPEILGRVVAGGGQWGEKPTSDRGVVLFTPDAVIGYKKRDRTSWKHVLNGVSALD
jgi:hypothetical protein